MIVRVFGFVAQSRYGYLASRYPFMKFRKACQCFAIIASAIMSISILHFLVLKV